MTAAEMIIAAPSADLARKLLDSALMTRLAYAPYSRDNTTYADAAEAYAIAFVDAAFAAVADLPEDLQDDLADYKCDAVRRASRARWLDSLPLQRRLEVLAA